MIIYRILIHTLHQFIESLGGKALEEGIGLALLAHTIDDILAFLHLAHHIHDDILIVLQVGIDTYHRITMVYRSFHTCPERILMASVMRQFDTMHISMFLGSIRNHLPSMVTTAIVDKQQFCVGISLFLNLSDQCPQHI